MSRDIEDRIAALARDQHGVVARAQLLARGLSPGAIRQRVRSGRLQILHRGIYLVGPIMPPHGRAMAAVLACGSGAVLSHRSAASLWGLISPTDGPAVVEVTVDDRFKRSRAGIHAWRARSLGESDRTHLQRIPVTTATRTLMDVASLVSGRTLEGAVARAQREGMVDPDALMAHLRRNGGRRGTPALRAVLIAGGGPALTRSEAEARLLALVREARLPTPEANVTIEGYEIDFFWRREGIAVEVDGYRYHSSRPRFESDRRRATHLAARGISVIRLTWRQIVEEGLATAVQLGQALLQARTRPVTLISESAGSAAGAKVSRRRR